MNRRVRTASVYILLIVIAFSLISYFSRNDEEIAKPDLMTFQKQVESGMVSSLVVEGNNGKGEYIDGAKFEIYLPAEDDELRAILKAHIPDLKYQPIPTAPWWTAILSHLHCSWGYGFSFLIRLKAEATEPCRLAKAGLNCMKLISGR